LQWVKQLWTLNIDATPASSSGTSITTDSSGGSVYVAGWTNGLIAGTTSNGGDDAFLAKYNAAGTRQWTQQFGTTYSDRAYGVACDSAGNVYTSGTVPSGNSFDENGFLSKHDPSGAFQWTRQIGSSTVEERGIGVVVDGSDGIYIAGDVFVFGSGGSLNTVPITANGEIFVIKYDTSGALKGTQLWTSSNSALMPFNTGVALSPDGGILVSGYTHNTSSGPNYSIMHKFTWP
jgi:hypothetical protein